MTATSTEATPSATPDPVEVVPLRHWGRWVSGAIVLVLVAAIIVGLSRAQINYGSVPGFFSESVMLTQADIDGHDLRTYRTVGGSKMFRGETESS